MLKGPTTNLAFLTGVLDSDGDGDRDLTQEGRRRAAENGLRKYRGESTTRPVTCDVVYADSQQSVPGNSSSHSSLVPCIPRQYRSQVREMQELGKVLTAAVVRTLACFGLGVVGEARPLKTM